MVMTLPAVAYGLVCVIIAAMCTSNNVDDSVGYCMPPTAFRDYSLTFWVASNMIICFVVIIIFAVAYSLARKSGHICFFSID
jgi:hypothetical protein